MAALSELLQLTNRPKNASDQWLKEDSHSDEDTDDEHEIQHEELLRRIQSLDGKTKAKRHKGPLRSESNQQLSEFNLKSGDNGKVNLDDLVGSLQTTSYHSNLKKTLESMQRMGKTVDAPLTKPTAEKIQRVVAYENTSKDISKWEPTVKKNRQAEHLSFPLDCYKPDQMSTGTLTTNFKPKTPLELEIANVLQTNSQMLERNNEELSKEEEEALKTMSLEEALERRNELRKLRALQSYYEQKCRRMKKIKSKKYHRIKRKAEKRAASKQTFEQLEKENPELARIELEKAEKLRVTERMSLKHRNTSKWAKNIITKGIKDVQARQALAEQLRISRQLTETKKDHSDSEDEVAEASTKHPTDTSDNILNFGLVGDSNENPWLLNDATAKIGDPDKDQVEDKHSGRERIRKLQSITASQTRRNDDSSQSDGKETDHSEEENFELMEENEAKANSRKRKKIKGRKTVQKKIDMKSNEKRTKTKLKKKERVKIKQKISEGLKDQKKAKKKREQTNTENSEINEKVEIESNTEHDVFLMESDGTETVMSEIENRQGKKVSEGSKNNSTVSETTGLNLNPQKVFQIEDIGTSGRLLNFTNESDDDEIQEQRMTIQEAFANDDVIEEFVEEKADAIEAGRPKDLNTSLPGWGDWGGPGVDETKRKKKFVVRAKLAPPRKDAKLAHVIINEERDKKFSKNQVTTLPFPFTSHEQWERSIRAPLGKHWNTVSVHKKLVKPRVTTLPGTVIEPIKPTKDIQRTTITEDSSPKPKGGKRTTVQYSGMKIHN